MNTLSLYFPSQFYFCLINKRNSFRGAQRRFPPTYALKTLNFQAIQSAFISLEMHSKQLKKICICSVILGQIESFRNYQWGLQYYFAENFRYIKFRVLQKWEFFLVTLSIAFSEYENFRFPFIAKTEQLKIGREMRKFNFRKSEEIIR